MEEVCLQLEPYEFHFPFYCYVYEFKWKSDEEFREEEYQEKVENISLYFDGEPTVKTSTYSTGDTYRYYWTDSDNGLEVICSRDFFIYGSPGYIEIKWIAEGETLEQNKEIP